MFLDMMCHVRQTTIGERLLNSKTAFAALVLTVGVSAVPASAQVTTATMTCEISSDKLLLGGSATVDVYLTNATDVRGYQVAIEVTRASGTGEVTVACPGGVTVEEGRGNPWHEANRKAQCGKSACCD